MDDRRRELPAPWPKDVPGRADADPASVRILWVLVGMGVDVRRQRRTIHALAHAYSADTAVGKQVRERHDRLQRLGTEVSSGRFCRMVLTLNGGSFPSGLDRQFVAVSLGQSPWLARPSGFPRRSPQMGLKTMQTASYAASATPTTWTANQTQSYSVTITNNGSQTWPAGGPKPAHLGGSAELCPGCGLPNGAPALGIDAHAYWPVRQARAFSAWRPEDATGKAKAGTKHR